MDVINLDDNLDLTDILDDINPSSSNDLSMIGGANPDDEGEGEGEDEGAEQGEINLDAIPDFDPDGDGDPDFGPMTPPLPEGDDDYGPKTPPLPEVEKPKLNFVKEGEGLDLDDLDEPDQPELTKNEPETPPYEPIDSSKKTFAAIPPPPGLYDKPASTNPDLTALLDKATQPKPSGIDKLPEEPATQLDISGGVELVPSGDFVQVEKYIENIRGLEYQRYLGELEDYFTSSKKKKNKQNFDYIVNSEGYFEKKCKPGVEKKGEEVVIVPPKYVNISDALSVINHNLDDIGYNLRELRDRMVLKDKFVSESEFNKLRQSFYSENDKKQIFLNYKNKINKTDENNKNILRLSLEKAELRNKLRRLFNEISELNRVPNKDYSLINLKIREYIESNKINNIDREINELKNAEVINYVVMEPPKITKPSAGEKPKKRIIKKKKEATEAEAPVAEDETKKLPEEEKPKKKKIVRKKKTKGGSTGKIDIDGLLDIVEDDINVETNETKEETENDLTKMISENLPKEEELVGGDNLDLDLDLDEIDFSAPLEASEEAAVEAPIEATVEAAVEAPIEAETKSVKIDLPNEGIEELDLGDDLEELSSYEDDEEMAGGGATENYSFENTYKKEVPEDKIDNQIPLKLEEDAPIQVKVVKIGHDESV